MLPLHNSPKDALLLYEPSASLSRGRRQIAGEFTAARVFSLPKAEFLTIISYNYAAVAQGGIASPLRQVLGSLGPQRPPVSERIIIPQTRTRPRRRSVAVAAYALRLLALPSRRDGTHAAPHRIQPLNTYSLFRVFNCFFPVFLTCIRISSGAALKHRLPCIMYAMGFSHPKFCLKPRLKRCILHLHIF